MWAVILSLIIAYLMGSIPTGLLVARYKAGIDIREHGSGSIGATNVLRTMGRRWAAFVFLCDVGKGAAAVLIVMAIVGSKIQAAPVPLAAVLGHAYPIFAGFKGGKGVATALGAYLALMPIPSLMALGTWIALVAVWRYVSLGSIVGCLSATLYGYIFDYPGEIILFAFLGGLFIMFRHRANMKRLFQGKEPTIGKKLPAES